MVKTRTPALRYQWPMSIYEVDWTCIPLSYWHCKQISPMHPLIFFLGCFELHAYRIRSPPNLHHSPSALLSELSISVWVSSSLSKAVAGTGIEASVHPGLSDTMTRSPWAKHQPAGDDTWCFQLVGTTCSHLFYSSHCKYFNTCIMTGCHVGVCSVYVKYRICKYVCI